MFHLSASPASHCNLASSRWKQCNYVCQSSCKSSPPCKWGPLERKSPLSILGALRSVADLICTLNCERRWRATSRLISSGLRLRGHTNYNNTLSNGSPKLYPMENHSIIHPLSKPLIIFRVWSWSQLTWDKPGCIMMCSNAVLRNLNEVVWRRCFNRFLFFLNRKIYIIY